MNGSLRLINSPSEVNFDERGLVPVVVQDARTLEVLMLAYANREAIEKTIETGYAHYFSRSRNELWKKGETSGNYQKVLKIMYDCDADALLYVVEQEGVACHTGERTCFYRTLAESGEFSSEVLMKLFELIKERKRSMPENSYTAKLFREGRKRIFDKVDEEWNEVKEGIEKGDRENVVWEYADLFYHLLVLMANEGVELSEVYRELDRRFKK